jgi:hypothetical protein
VYIVDFVEAVVAAVGPEPHGEERNRAGFTLWFQWKSEGITSIKDGSNNNYVQLNFSLNTLSMPYLVQNLNLYLYIL